MYWLGRSQRKKFEADTKNIKAVQEQFLLEILKDSKDTEFGKRFDFQNIKSREDFKQHVPLSYYDIFQPYIQRIEETGEKNLLSSYELVQLAMTSGTSGHKKLLPFTKKHRSTFFFQGITIIYNTLLTIPGIYCLQKTCKIMHQPKRRISKSGIRIGPNSSSPDDSKSLLDLYTTPADAYLKVNTEKELVYLHLLYALKDEYLGQIESNFVTAIYQFFVFLESNWNLLCDDIRTGSIQHIQINDPKLLNSLNKSLRGPDPKRADKLEAEFKKGFDNIAKRVWPDLRCLLTVNTGCSFELYKRKLEHFVDPALIPTYSPLYAASEGLIGVNINIKKGEYVFVPKGLFLEFIPIDNRLDNSPKTLFIDQVEEGECYELVITNLSGLYRYRMGDVIKIVGFHNQCPVMEFQYRTGQILNVKGEKTSEQQLFDAIKLLSWHSNIVDFTSIDYINEADKEVPYYSIYVELGLNESSAIDLPEKQELDDALCTTNPIYESFRVKGSIGELSLSVVQRGTFQELKELLIEEGTGINQVKLPRVLRKEAHISLLKSRVTKNI